MKSSASNPAQPSRLPGILETHEADLLSAWIKEQLASVNVRKDLMKEAESFLRFVVKYLETEKARWSKVIKDAGEYAD